MALLKKLFFTVSFFAVVLLFLASRSRAQTAAVSASRIGIIDDSSRVVLANNHHPLATAANDLGEVSPALPMERMLLVLTRGASTESALQKFLAAQQDKSSTDFHSWLTSAQFGSRFGVSPADLQKLTAWLASHVFA